MTFRKFNGEVSPDSPEGKIDTKFEVVEYRVYGNGKTRHISNSKAPKPVGVMGGTRGSTLCNMFFFPDQLMEPEGKEKEYPVCGACKRTAKARGRL